MMELWRFRTFAEANLHVLDLSTQQDDPFGKATIISRCPCDPITLAWEEGQRIGTTNLWRVLSRHDIPLGAFALIRTSGRPFNDREIELVRRLQIRGIAIENVRLFDEVQGKSRNRKLQPVKSRFLAAASTITEAAGTL